MPLIEVRSVQRVTFFQTQTVPCPQSAGLGAGLGVEEFAAVAALDSRLSVAEFSNGGLNPGGGEINVPLSRGELAMADVHATLGEVIEGTRSGREGDEITVFDSTGLAIQDVAVARIVYDEAGRRGLGRIAGRKDDYRCFSMNATAVPTSLTTVNTRSLTRSRVVVIVPPTTVPWPQRYLVVEWIDRSAPSSNGRW